MPTELGRIHTNFNYIDIFRYVSTSAGSNKTGGALDVIKNNCPMQNYIYVAPRLDLLKEIMTRAKEKGVHQNLELISSLNNYTGESVTDTSLKTINNLQNKNNRIIFLTTVTFINIVSRIKNKENFKIIIDEEMESYWYQAFTVEENNLSGLDLLEDFIEEDSDNSLRIKDNKSKLATQITRTSAADNSLEDNYKNLKLIEILKILRNDAIDSYRCVNNKAAITIFSYLKPHSFINFQEVTFLCAHFEDTILFRLWNKKFNISFKAHSLYQQYLNNLTEAQGGNVMIGYLLDDDDSASRSTLERDVSNGKTCDNTDYQVIDKAIDYVDSTFEEPYLCALNKLKLKEVTVQQDKMGKYSNGTFVTTAVSGINIYSKINNVAVLATTNPSPEVNKLLQTLLGITAKEVMYYHQVHNDAQVCGRIIRDIDNTEIKTLIVLAKSSAIFLNQVYSKSCLIGKVGDFPSYKALRKQSKRPSKAEEVANEITLVLDQSITPRRPFKEVKKTVSNNLGYHVSNKVWRNARSIIAANDGYWGEQGYSFVKVA